MGTTNKKREAKIVDRGGGFSVVDCGVGKFAIGLSAETNYNKFSTFFNLTSSDWDGNPIGVTGVRCVPWGMMNDMPEMVRDILEKNNLGPGILRRKLGLIYGQGPRLYKWELVNNELQQTWIEDNDIQGWLDTWDYKKYLRNAMNEYVNMDGHFTKYVSGKAVRIGKAWISRLESMPSGDCRLIWPDGMTHPRLEDIQEVLTGDMINMRETYSFPIFDKYNANKYEAAIGYHNLRSFGRNLYSISSFHGSIPWMQDSNDIADIVRVLNDNLIASAYIVHEPQAYWDQKRNDMLNDHPTWTDERINQEMDMLRDSIIKKLAEVMAGKRNAGKFFTCVDFTDEMGHAQSWKIEPIEMNLDKYIEAQKDISRLADSAATSGLGLSPSLANIIIDGKSDSGSQMLYALKIFFGADTQIPEDIVTEAINDAIRINFPKKKGIFMGFYRKVIQKEDNVSAGDRAINQA